MGTLMVAIGPSRRTFAERKAYPGSPQGLAGYGKLAVEMSAPARPRRKRTYFFEAPLRRPGLVLLPIVFLSLAAAAIAHLLPPRYSTSALVRAEWETADEALLQQRGIDLDSRRSQAVRQRVTDRVVLERVVREATPYATGSGSASLDEQVERLQSDLRVRSMASSSFVIEFVHRDPAMAARVPNLVARQLAAAEGDGARAEEALGLEARLEEARLVLKQKTDALGRLASTAQEPRVEDNDSAPPEEDAFAERRVVAASLATARSRAERLRQVIEAEARSTAAPTPQQELERLRTQLAELRKRYTEEHPDVEKLRRQILRLEASLPPVPAGTTSPQEELRATEAEIEQLVARLKQLEARTASPQVRSRPAAAPAGADPARAQAVLEHERAQKDYQALLERRTAAAAPRPGRSPIRRFELLREATVPSAPESPGPVLFALVGALAGLATGLVAAVVSEHRDRRVKGPEDLEDILPVPLLAILPEVHARDPR